MINLRTFFYIHFYVLKLDIFVLTLNTDVKLMVDINNWAELYLLLLDIKYKSW